jgi:pimeloyl-ACP methyl ester carboxylesterase
MDKTGAQSPRSHPLFRRIVLILAFGVFLLAAAGFLYENIAEARDRRFNPMAGKLVEVNGRMMHIDCSGDGNPTVVLDSGLGDTYLSWRKVQPEISKFARVCSYDRAGLGFSESVSGPRTSKVIAEQLHALLQAAHVAPPYIVVGHSMGGYDVRLYASLYPNEVAGMVLVDASHPEQDKRFPPEIRNMQGSWMREAEFLEYTMPFGIPRLMGFCEHDPSLRAAECNWRTAHGGLAEMRAFPQSASETAATGTLGNIPLAVLSHDPEKPSSELSPDLAKPMNQEWEKMQEELSHLSSRGTQTIAKNSSHYIQLDRPEIVIDAVRSVVQQARQSQSAAAPSTR